MGRRNGRRTGQGAAVGVLASALFASALLAALGPAASAEPSAPPQITGTPVVGETLTASPPNGGGGGGVYKWQRCDPVTASPDCSGGGGKDDPNYVTIVEGQGAQTYTLTPGELGAFIRVQTHATNIGEQSFVPSAPVGPVVAAPQQQPQPQTQPQPQQQPVVPQHGVQLAGRPADGTVRFKPPGAKGYSPLTTTTAIPVNSLIDTRRGSIVLTAATGEFGSPTPDDSVEFFDGLFKIKQAADTDSSAIAKLLGKLGCGKGNGNGGAARASGGPLVASAARRRGGRRLWGRGSGRYGTRGRGGTGSVVGTTWFTKDTCKGTKFKVTEGTGINVTRRGSDKQIFLGPGDSYFARD